MPWIHDNECRCSNDISTVWYKHLMSFLYENFDVDEALTLDWLMKSIELERAITTPLNNRTPITELSWDVGSLLATQFLFISSLSTKQILCFADFVIIVSPEMICQSIASFNDDKAQIFQLPSDIELGIQILFRNIWNWSSSVLALLCYRSRA